MIQSFVDYNKVTTPTKLLYASDYPRVIFLSDFLLQVSLDSGTQEMKYAAFSDGEAERVTSAASRFEAGGGDVGQVSDGGGGGGRSSRRGHHGHHHHHRRSSAASISGDSVTRESIGRHHHQRLSMPHYVTMSRTSRQAAAAAEGGAALPWDFQASSAWGQTAAGNNFAFFAAGGGGDLRKGALRYSSQPFLNAAFTGAAGGAAAVPGGTLGANILDYSMPLAPQVSAASAAAAARFTSPSSQIVSSGFPPSSSGGVAKGISPSSVAVTTTVAASSSSTSVASASRDGASASIPPHPSKGPPPLASKSQLERLNYKTSAVITKIQVR